MKAGLLKKIRVVLPLLLVLVLATGGLVASVGSSQAAGPVTIKSKIKEILDAPGGEEVLRKCLGDEAVDNPQLSMAFGMSLPTVAPMSGGLLTDEMVACVDEGLQALASGGGSTTAAASEEPTTASSSDAESASEPEPLKFEKKTVFNVTVTGESPLAALISVSDGTPFSQEGTGEGITFQMIVDNKLKTEKVKSIKKGTADYYKVDIKKIKIPDTYFTLDGNKFKVTTKASNAKGKLYVSGGDVDVSQLMGKSKPKETIGDGTADAEGSLLIPKFKLTVTVYGPDQGKKKGKKMMSIKTVSTLTTGQSQIVVDELKKSKSGLAGLALPGDGPEGVLPNPLQGAPLDLEAGAITLVSTTSVMNVKINAKAAPPPPASGGLTIDNTIEELNANPATRAAMLNVLGEEDWGKAVQLVGSMTFRAASKLSDKFGGDKINAIIDALAAAQAEEGEDAGPPPISLVGDADLLCGQMWSLQITPK